MFKKILFILLVFAGNYSAKNFTISGFVVDGSNSDPLMYANLRVLNSNIGTSANQEGEFILNLENGQYTIITSYIGYISDTINISVDDNLQINISLKPTQIEIGEVVVKPGINPAIAIVQKAIEQKHSRNKLLNTYKFSAYTKGLAKTTSDMTTGNNSISLGIGESDTTELKVTGIIENESIGYFQKPDNYKDEIIARKQSANTPSTINIFTGGRLIQNFYTDDIRFIGNELTGPIADNSLDYYYFYLQDSLLIDNNKVYQILIEPLEKEDPGFVGNIFIETENYNLIKLDLSLNSAANPGQIFNKINIFQQFLPYDDDIYMPIDYRIFVEGNYLGLIKFGFELNSIFYDYDINCSMGEDIFDMVAIKVSSEADKKDSLYWKSVRAIPNTQVEIDAYRRIDSLESVPFDFWENYSLFSFNNQLGKNFTVSGPLGIYHFNKIEGNALDFKFRARRLFDKRFSGNANFSYGFADKKMKFNSSLSYLLGEYRNDEISFSIFNSLKTLYNVSDNYNELSSTLLSLLSKYDFRDYYYRKGFTVEYKNQVFPILKLGIGYSHFNDISATNNSNFSFFNKNKKYRENKSITQSNVNALTATFNLDFRKYIEDGYFRRRINQQKNLILLSGKFFYSNSSFLKSDFDFKILKLNLWNTFYLMKNTTTYVDINSFISFGNTPLQYLYALPGNIDLSSKSFSFRTLKYNEVFGDQVYSINIQQNFGDKIFRLLNIPFIKDSQILLSTHFNFAWSFISPENKSNIAFKYKEFKTPFIEAGFGLSHVLVPLSFEFTWKLNHFDNNNFVFGINAFIL